MKTHEITASEISRRLSDRAESVCQILLPGGRQIKDEWVCSDVSGGEGNSLKVHLSGSHQGQWRDWASGEHGDLIDLWRLSRNISRQEAFRQVKQYLGIREDVYQPPKEYSKPPVKNTVPPIPKGQAHNFLTGKRKLTESTLERFKICTENKAIIFPCYSPDGELLNRSYRTLDENKQVWQDKDCPPCLFGWHALPESSYNERTVLLAEGQIDAMTWDQWGIPALSIPAGSGQTWINFEWDNLAIFDKLLIAFDSDASGQKNAQSVIARLGPHRCYLVQIPEKDANDALQAGRTAADAKEWIAKAKPPQLQGVISGTQMEARLLAEIAPKPKPFTLKFMDIDWEDDQKGFFFRDGEVTLWTGATGNGKSTFLNFLQSLILFEEKGIFVASMEIKPERTLRKMAECFYGICGTYRKAITATDFQSWIWRYGEHITFADRVGFIAPDEILQMMNFTFKRYGAKHYVIDSLMRVEGLEEDYPKQGAFMNDLAEFSHRTGGHVHIVAHPRKMQAGRNPGALDIKGSSLIPNNADNVIAVSRNVEKWDLIKAGKLSKEEEEAMHDAEVTVEKQRESGWSGTFYLKFDHRKLKFETFVPPKKK